MSIRRFHDSFSCGEIAPFDQADWSLSAELHAVACQASDPFIVMGFKAELLFVCVQKCMGLL
jgi:hypothetical protein